MTPTKLSFRNEGMIKTFSEKHTEGLHHHQTCLTGNAKELFKLKGGDVNKTQDSLKA
jgi:hypothetical protein